MAADDSRSLMVPVVIAAMGLIPLALMIPSGNSVEVPAQPAAVVQVIDPVAVEVPATVPAPTEIVIETPTPVLGGVSDPVARVLAAQGFANQEQVAGIPASVLAVLVDQNVVLTVAVGSGN